jgi:hypothetical protein
VLQEVAGASVVPILASCNIAAVQGSPEGFRSPIGCCIAPADFGRVQVYNLPPGQQIKKYDARTDPIIGWSGRGKDFDEALGEVLVMLSQTFRVNPGFGFYDDSGSMNALATQVSRVEGTRDLVVFGRTMLNHLLSLPRDGESAVVAVCAHEFGHIYQYASVYYNRLQNTLPRHCPCVELHADFLAGYFLYQFERERPVIGLQGVGDAWETMGSSDFNRSSSHGTSRQRIAAIEGGYSFARDSGGSLAEAARAAYEHVQRTA